MGKLPAWLADPEPTRTQGTARALPCPPLPLPHRYVPVLRPHNIVERVAAITEKAASGALATVRGNTSRFISVRSVRSSCVRRQPAGAAPRGASSTRRARARPPPSSPTSALARPAPAAPTPGAPRRRELEIRRFARRRRRRRAAPAQAEVDVEIVLGRRQRGARVGAERAAAGTGSRWWCGRRPTCATSARSPTRTSSCTSSTAARSTARCRSRRRSATIASPSGTRRSSSTSPPPTPPSSSRAGTRTSSRPTTSSRTSSCRYRCLSRPPPPPPMTPATTRAARLSALNFEFLLRASEARRSRTARSLSSSSGATSSRADPAARLQCLHREEGRPGLHTGRSTAKSGRFTAREEHRPGRPRRLLRLAQRRRLLHGRPARQPPGPRRNLLRSRDFAARRAPPVAARACAAARARARGR